MWVVVESPEGEEVHRRELTHEIMDERAFAEKYASAIGLEISPASCSHGCACLVPSGCGDLRVEFRDDPDNSVRIWSGESFFFKREDE